MSWQKKSLHIAAAGISLVAFLCALAPPSLWSDNKADYFRFFRFPSFVQNGSARAHWMNDGNSFWYAEGSRDNTVIYKVDPIKNTKEPLFDAQRLRQALIPLLGSEPSQKGLPFQTFAFVEGEKAVEFMIEKKKFIMDLDSYTVKPAPSLSEKIIIHTQPIFLEDGERFIWASERDGWEHFYLYDIQGNLICRLTRGDFPVVDVAAVDEEEGWIYFTAHAEERPYDTHLYRVDMKGGGFSRLTEGTGQHSIQFSPSYKFFLDNHSSITRPPVAELSTADGTLVQTLSRANIDALKRMNWTPPEEFVVKASDQKTDLYGVLFKPCGFDPQRKYPVIDYIYNGPNRTHVPREFTVGLWPRALAQMECVVLVVDGRGTPERGKAFQDVVYRNFGRNEIPDHTAVLRELAKERPYMDLNRVGLLGGSWGGYMTIRAMLMATDVYHVGIAYYPVADLYDHTKGIERYMCLPQDNRAGYEYASNIRLAKHLKGKLLLIAGTSDVNAPFTATMKMVDAFIKAEKSFDLIIIPEQDHSLRGNGQYILEAARRYFEEHLFLEK